MQVAHLRHRLGRVPPDGPGGLVGLGVLGERLVQALGDRRVPDEQAVRLGPERAVDPGERLHQRGPPHRLVEVEGVQGRGVESGEQHGLDDDELQFVVRVGGPPPDRLQLCRAAYVLADVWLVLRPAGVDDLDLAQVVGVRVPFGPQLDDLVVQPRADVPGGADDHALAGAADELAHLLRPGLPVRDQVLGERPQPVGRPVDRVHRRHRTLDARLLGVVQAGGDGVGALVDRLRVDVGGQVDRDEPALVVDAHGRAVVDGPGQVVDVDVVAEHVAGVAVGLRDRGAGEGDEGGVGQRVAQVPGVPVEAVVVAAVGLVDDDDDVAAVRQQRVAAPGVALLPGAPELLQRGEDDPAGTAVGEFGAQLLTGEHLDRILGQQVAAGERFVELVVQVGPVGDDDDGRVAEARVGGDLVRVEFHLHRLAGTLRVPDHAGLAVAAGRLDRLADGLLDREVLVRLGDSFNRSAPGLGEGDVAGEQVEEPARREQAVQREVDGEVRVAPRRLRHRLATIVHIPWGEVLVRGERGAVPGGDTVGDDADDVGPEGKRQLLDVGADLAVRALQVGVRVAGLLKLDQPDRQPVEVADYVEATLVVAIDDHHLVGDEVVVGVLIAEVDQPDGRIVLGAVLVGVDDRPDALDHPVVQPPVLVERVTGPAVQHQGHHLVDMRGWKLRVEPSDRLAQPAGQDHLRPRLALPCPRRDRCSGYGFPAQLRQRVQRERLPIGLGHVADGHFSSSPLRR